MVPIKFEAGSSRICPEISCRGEIPSDCRSILMISTVMLHLESISHGRRHGTADCILLNTNGY